MTNQGFLGVRGRGLRIRERGERIRGLGFYKGVAVVGDETALAVRAILVVEALVHISIRCPHMPGIRCVIHT